MMGIGYDRKLLPFILFCSSQPHREPSIIINCFAIAKYNTTLCSLSIFKMYSMNKNVVSFNKRKLLEFCYLGAVRLFSICVAPNFILKNILALLSNKKLCKKCKILLIFYTFKLTFLPPRHIK